jgi:hypothetical protein
MINHSCPCCSNPRVWLAVEDLLDIYGAEIHYCPVCGQQFETIEDENGNPMLQNRVPWSDRRGPLERPSLGIDLDKIDISREIQILAKHNNIKHAKLLDALVMEHLKRMLDDRDIEY